jgi:hypothetical protein
VRRILYAGLLVLVLGASGVAARLIYESVHSLEVKAYWEPLKESRYDFASEWSELRNLRPAKATAAHRQADFRVFLPPREAAVGAIWELDPPRLLPFLQQFHVGATTALHHGSGSAPGAFAALRARNDQFDEVVFRLHAEFVLSDGKSYYTPAQFSGQLLFDRLAHRVEYFHLFLPPRKTNVDVNRYFPVTLVGNELVENSSAVDVGYSPRMELEGGDARLIDSIAWDESVPRDEMMLKLAERFYEFLQVRWHPWDEAVAEAQRSGKPLHVVVLLGTLDDEAC